MSGQGRPGERVLRLLKNGGGFVSSQEICRQLGITRAAVWKLVEGLRRKGFRIDGQAALGYRLQGVPDSLAVLELDPGIETLRLGKTVVFRQVTGSTNEDLWKLAERGAAEGTAVLAEAQEAGRGRRGRRWESPSGRNLYLSVLLRPALPPWEATLITLLGAVEVCRTIEELFGLEARIKWPNDVLLTGRKVAGILAEMQAEQEAIRFLILGIGVNLNMTGDMFPDELLYPGVSVAMVLGRPVDRLRFTRRLFERIDWGYDEFLRSGGPPLVREWMRLCAHPDALLEVSTPAGLRAGIFRGLDADGAMILETEGGQRETIRAGDVIRVSPGGRKG
jgi:BirA family transcriptional regulator, biotin operon repressor / biotin---[acetyl-CoA-carboxylase] ligase